MSKKEKSAPEPAPPETPPGLSKELHPSRGLSEDSVTYIIRLARRDTVVHRQRRAVRGGQFTEYTKGVIQERREQKQQREQDS